ncbi:MULTISPECIES: 30S ribosomal protein S19e [Halolamina]|uniref:Small ribosomal subunit protein eS19 n=1 Tax=Halolamina pelagica TaxID=699431 RepID=A0A1I5Q712_9EURY|nr:MULTISPECIES: 30S ribosomal protein S19e [Halolamina]NHX35123.1 30S ribosomal protein S19e [Halolamina sp. R1-12]SFP41992.1 small subunit ribosomal protein S19e [Halolamina pelagica]
MVTLYDVPAEDLLEALAEELDGRIEEPDWVEFTKTGVDRELPPQQEDFWQVRTASLLRKVAIRGPVGVERLATEYGGSKKGTTRYRVSGNEHTGGSRKIIRVALQQLEEEGLVETAKGEGRRVTDEGQSLLDTVAGETLEDLDRPELQKYA